MPRLATKSHAVDLCSAAGVAELRVRLASLPLTKTEIAVLTARLGLDGTVLTYKEVAAKTGMVPTMVRELEHRVLSRVGL